MTTTEDLFEPLVNALPECGVAHGPSELHGVICGLEGSGSAPEDDRLLTVLAEHVDRHDPWPEPVAGYLLRLRQLTREGLHDEDMELTLLLPGEREEFGMRLAALAQWCEGFLAGFGTGSAGLGDGDLSPELQEALSDLSAVTQVETPPEQGEEEETMLEQVTEHCRMAALMVFTERVLRNRPDQNPGTLH